MPEVSILQPRGRGGQAPQAPTPVKKPAPAPARKSPPKRAKPPSFVGGFMPSLIRFLILVGGVVAAVYGAMYFLVANVQVQPREITEIVEIPKAAK